jgi:glycine/D-amino acid oxidase-like deaminating enzyme
MPPYVNGSVDVAIIGGGIIGTSAAAFLAEAGMRVALFERDGIGAAASGRNSGAIQHPFDEHLAPLHQQTLRLYAELEKVSGFRLPRTPAGLLLLSDDHAAVRRSADDALARAPELLPAILDPYELRKLEPGLGDGLSACRLETGYPVAPAAATLAYATRAERAGARLITDADSVRLVIDGDRVSGVRPARGPDVSAGQVLVACGPWSSDVVPGWRSAPPVRPVWGVVVGTRLARPPGHVLEELGIDRPGRQAPELFSLVTADSVTSVGSTFLDQRPEPTSLVTQIVERATRFVPDLGEADVTEVRACARPVASDGRPLIGAIPSHQNLFVCTGHGPWGISTGPASARLVVEQMLAGARPPEVFDPARPM